MIITVNCNVPNLTFPGPNPEVYPRSGLWLARRSDRCTCWMAASPLLFLRSI